MADKAHAWTDKQLERMEKRITKTYKQAQSEITEKWNAYMARAQKRTEGLQAAYEAALKTGSASEIKAAKAALDKAKENITFKNQYYKDMVDETTLRLANVNQIAVNYMNDQMPSIYTHNYNQAGDAASVAGLKFSAVSEGAVKERFIEGKADTPYMHLQKYLDIPKDQRWNTKKLNSSVLQGIIQGESMQDIAKRILPVVDYNASAAIRNARTMVTGAENQGRQDGNDELERLGAVIEKEWLATPDARTRDSHAAIDGERVPNDKKFSNKLMYPGDPSGAPEEVYNCRCTMVSEIVGVKNADGTVKDVRVSVQEPEPEPQAVVPAFDHSFWDQYNYTQTFYSLQSEQSALGQEFAGTLKECNYDKPSTAWKAYVSGEMNAEDAQKIDAILGKAKGTGSPEKPKSQKALQKEEAQKALQDAQDALAQIPDDAYSGIWKDDVHLSDYEEKAGKIQAKYDYFNAQKAADPDNPKWDELIAKLDDYDKKGKEYFELQQQVADAQSKVDQLGGAAKKSKKAVTELTIGNDELYTREAKNAAVWAQTPGEADKVLRGKCGEVWRSASELQKDAAYDYTSSYSKFNEPLRGYEYGTNRKLGVGHTDLDAGYRHNGKQLDALTDMIDKSSYDHDMWLQRGCRYDGMDDFFGVDIGWLQRADTAELRAKLLGSEPVEYGFMSCGDAKGKGFSNHPIILNVYAPRGTKMLYMEPFSAFGMGDMRSWDGISKQYDFGYEAEVLIQQHTAFKVTKIERARNGTIYADIEAIEQRTPQRWKKKK